MEYKEYNDFELLSYIREQNEDANELMFIKYKPLIKSIAQNLYHKCNNKGLEISDLIQEGMIGLSYAINSYNENREASFFTYAKMCIENKIKSVVLETSRLKNKILNESLPIDSGNESLNIIDIVSDDSKNPLKVMIKYEYQQEIYKLAKNILTPKEEQVFELWMAGFDYKEISDILEEKPKVIDNALQRIKTKFKKNAKINS